MMLLFCVDSLIAMMKLEMRIASKKFFNSNSYSCMNALYALDGARKTFVLEITIAGLWLFFANNDYEVVK